MEFLRVFCAFLLLGLAVCEDNCPTLSVSPCTCTKDPYPVLECDRLYNTDVLRKVFLNSAGTKYDEVRLTNSVLQYIPHDIFDEVEVAELYLINGTLGILFDETPKSMPSLEILSIVNTQINRVLQWEQLQHMENLETLKIYSTEVKVLGSKFAQYAPKSLKEISFDDTKTTKIEAGVFEHFPNLKKVSVGHSALKELKRDMFPVPFNGKYLHFDYNQLSSIPTDMFSSMPKLSSVSLEGNRLTTLERDIFEHMSYLNLKGNPLICNCGLAWLMKHKMMQLEGTCYLPKTLRGRKLYDVYRNTSCRV